ncbi:MAG: hypothetical protein WC412_02110 [Candidatus Omnitrophota bacterium]
MLKTEIVLQVEPTTNLMRFVDSSPNTQTNDTSPITARGKPSKYKNFFPMPHGFEEKFGKQFNTREKYFYTTLCRLKNRLANDSGWFWHTDVQFKQYGFNRSKLCEMRKKFISAGLLETKRGHTKSGARGGTNYKVNTDL